MNYLDWNALYCIQSLAAGVISGTLGIYLMRSWKNPEAQPLVLLVFAVSEWALSYAAEYGSTGLESKLFWVRMEYVGCVWVSPLFLAFVLRIVGKGREFTPASLAVFLIIPTLTLAGVWTNGFHDLMWSAAWLDASDRFPVVVYARGPLFWLYMAFTYGLLLFATTLLLRAFLTARGVYRKQLGVILLGSFVPWIANALYTSNLSPFLRADFTPFAFMVSSLMLAYALSRYRLLDLRPVAREAVMENMADAVLVLDTQDRLVDLNAAAAERVVSGVKGDIIGSKAEEVLPDLFPLVARHRSGREMQAEIHLGSKADAGDYELRVSPLYHRRGHQAGWLVILRDISERKQAEAERIRLEARLQRARKMEAIGTLAGGVAHDLNNILSGIMTYPDLLLIQVPDDSQLRKPLETIRKTGEKAAAIVQDLLTLARRGVYAEEVILLNDVVSSYL
ncbi:MAG: histidine kinase N-terminal 7TM domain-containing protein, partial [Desulfobacteraceae bacterium]